MRLLLVRHGESTWNVEGRYQGRLEPPLSPRGRAQAQALATRLAGERICAIVSSPLQRARATADICAGELSLPVSIENQLTEISHGGWEGKLVAEIKHQWPDMLAAWQSTPHLVRFPGGESLDDVHRRLRAFLENVPMRISSREYDLGCKLLALTHDVIVRLAVLEAQRKSLASFNEVRVDNAALNEFSLEDGKLKVIRLNDTEHLGSLRSDTLTQAL